MASQLIQMVTVVDKSGKAVNSSKHIVDVWKEAKAAYKERKAEVAASRRYESSGVRSPRTIKEGKFEDDLSRASSRRHSRPHGSRHTSHEGHLHSTRSPRSGASTPNSIYPSSDGRLSRDLSHSHSAPTSPGIQRSVTAHDGELQPFRPPPLPARSYTSPPSPAVDMSLAYGELPGPLPLTPRHEDEQELKGLVSTVKRLLEEADCLHHSAQHTIAKLQKNPDAMAAVGLALAEISNIARKMAPGALMNMSSSAPAVFRLLASPQFLIAGGVAVGVTIVAFGGYKIIKKIREKQANEDPGMEEMIEIGGDANRIENWRRGIAEEQAQSSGTSVDGEFITPQAAALSRLNLADTETFPRSEIREKKNSGSVRTGSEKRSKRGSRSSSKTISTKSESKDGGSFTGKEKKEKKAKKPSPLRLMFR